jgi:hypothetical protein
LESSALNEVVWFGIVQLVGLVASWSVGFYSFGVVFSSAAGLGLGPNPTSAQVASAVTPLFRYLAFVLPLSVSIQVVALVVLTLALREFAKVDRAKFSVPSLLTILMIVGAVVAAFGVSLLLGGIPDIISKAPNAPGSVPSQAFFAAIGSLISDVIVLVIGGVLALVGLVGGLILGLWRVGARYNETTVKLGAIFVIIPLLNIAAPILVLIGAYEARKRLIGSC